MMTVLNAAYEVKDQRSIIWKLTSLAVALGSILLVFVAIGSGALAAFAGTLMPWFPGAVLVLIRFVTYALLAIIVITGVSLLFRLGRIARVRDFTGRHRERLMLPLSGYSPVQHSVSMWQTS